MTPSVSVVIPAYNAERFLKDAVESVLRQTTSPLEILVVDDGSTDETGRLARALPGVRCIHQENAGVSVARNRGIKESRGRFVALPDADDVWEDAKLATQVASIRDDCFAFSARTETDEHLKPLRVVKTGHNGPLLEGLLFHGNVVGTPSSVLAPREAFLGVGGVRRQAQYVCGLGHVDTPGDTAFRGALSRVVGAIPGSQRQHEH